MLDSLLLPPPADATVARSHGTGSHGTGQHGTRAHGVRSRGASNGAQMVQRFAASEGIALHPAAVTLASGARVMVDGLDEDETLFVEAHAAPGPLTHLDLVRLTQDVFTAFGSIVDADGLVPYLDYATPTMGDTLGAALQDLLAKKQTPQQFFQTLQKDYGTYSEKNG